MGQFYKTTPGEFIDFTYKPDMKLELELAQKQVESDYLKKQLLEEAPDIKFEYWDYDKDTANEIQNYYKDQINDLSQKLYNDPDNSATYLRQMGMLQRELKEDFAKGKIYKLGKNLEGYKDFKTRWDSLENPIDKEAYWKMLTDYQKQNPNGALDNIFEAGQMYATPEIVNGFLSSDAFKQLKETYGKTLSVTSDGKWMYKTSTGWKELSKDRINDAMKLYLQSQPNLIGRAKAGSKYFNEHNWLDENGDLRFDEGSYLGNIIKKVSDTYSYKNIEKYNDKEYDKLFLMNEQANISARATTRANGVPPEQLLYTGKDVSSLAQHESSRMMQFQRKILKNAQNEIGRIIKFEGTNNSALTGLPQVNNEYGQPRDIKEMIKYIRDTRNNSTTPNGGSLLTPNQLDALENLEKMMEKSQAMLEQGMYATYSGFKQLYPGITDKQIAGLQKEITKFVSDSAGDIKSAEFYFDGMSRHSLKQIFNNKDDKYIDDIVKNGRRMSLNYMKDMISKSGSNFSISISPNLAVPSIIATENYYNSIYTPVTISNGDITYTAQMYIPMNEIGEIDFSVQGAIKRYKDNRLNNAEQQQYDNKK